MNSCILHRSNRLIMILVAGIFCSLFLACEGGVTYTSDTQKMVMSSPTQFMQPTTPATSRPNATISSTSPPAVVVHNTPESESLKTPTTQSPTLSPARQATNPVKETSDAYWKAKVATEMAILPGCIAPIERSYSPDGNWVAIECVEYMTGVYNLNEPSIAWQLKYGQVFGLEYDQGNQFGSLHPTHWSVDGLYLYLSPFPCCLDDINCSINRDGLALLRLELTTGRVTYTLNSGMNSKFYNVSFSSNDTYLAYFRTWQKYPILTIHNLITGADRQIPIGEQYSQAGYIIWSPDKERIVFSARSGDDCQDMIYYLIMLELNDENQTVLLTDNDSDFIPVEWLDENHIILKMGASFFQSLDLTTGDLSPYQMPTPTSEP